MKQVLKINILTALLALFGLGLTKLNFPYLQLASGLIIYFVIAYDFSIILEKISRQRFGSIKMILWTFLLAYTLNPVIYYSLYLTKGFTSVNFITFFSLGVLAILAGIYLIIDRYFKKESTQFRIESLIINKLFLVIFGLFVIAISVNFFLYRFIPEADPYTYLITLKRYLASGAISTGETRPLFIIFSSSLCSLSGISCYWLFKIVIPLFSFPLLLIFYDLSRQKISNKFLMVLSSVSFLLFPIILLEILIARPQSLFLYSLPIVLYLLSDNLKKRSAGSIFGILLILATELLSAKMHQFFFLGALVALIALIYYLWPLFKKQSLLSVFLVLVGLSAVSPVLNYLGMFEQIKSYLILFGNYLIHPRVDLWFIDNYKNVNVSQVGWPGIMALFYYGYNLGLLFPVTVLMLVIRKKKLNLDIKNNWVYLVSFLIFFSIAEIFPRLGLAFLPDRAWLFTSISLCFFLPLMLKGAFSGIKNTYLTLVVFLIMCLSFGASWGITYEKQGWVTKNEEVAISWLKASYGENNIVISQRSTGAFLELQGQIDYSAPRLFYKDKNEFYNLVLSESKQKPGVKIFILFSTDKFNTLYGKRDWWKSLNDFNAPVEDIFSNDHYELIYSSDGVKIWQFKG